MPMYQLMEDGKAITCLRCNFTSHHPRDVANLYCVRCHLFLDQEAPYEHFVQLLGCVQLCLKSLMGSHSIEPTALQGVLLNTLENIMGQGDLARWLQQQSLHSDSPSVC